MSVKNTLVNTEQLISNNQNSYAEFWQWFQKHQHEFYQILNAKNQDAIQEGFFDKLWTELVNVHDGIFFLAGMADEHTAELILTPDGVIRNIIFVEELIAAAPEITGWKFTALKPASEIHQTCIGMHDYEFSQDTLSFYLKDHPECPDEIDVC